MISWRLERPFYYLLLVLLFLLPDAVYGVIDARFPVCFDPEKLALLAAFAVSLSFVKDLRFVAFVLGVFGAMQLFEFSAMAYFGAYPSAFAWLLMLSDIKDVALETAHVAGRYWYLPLVIFVPYALFIWRLATVYRRRTFRGAEIVPILFGVVFLIQANTQSGFFKMTFRQTCYASFNTMNAFAAFVGNIGPRSLFSSGQAPEFKPYELTRRPDVEGANVIVIFGESLSRRHMSLFGYARPTTPLMERRAMKDKDFVYKEAFAGAVNTFVAVPAFLHLQREPQNFKKQQLADTYLPKMARQNGFKTAYVGFQGRDAYRKTGISFMDQVLVYEPVSGYNELVFFKDAFSKIDLTTGRSFVFINKRNPHVPYENGYAFNSEKYTVFPTADKEASERIVNAYDNAMLFEDEIINEMLDYFEKSTDRPTYVYYLADHGEALGEGGVWGHVSLAAPVYETPFAFKAFHSFDSAYTDRIKDGFYPTAYEIGLLVADRIGYEVTNPNSEEGVFYVNGPDAMGRAGFVKLVKDRAGNRIDSEIVRPLK